MFSPCPVTFTCREQMRLLFKTDRIGFGSLYRRWGHLGQTVFLAEETGSSRPAHRHYRRNMPPSTMRLSELVDLSLGTPDMGVVNFNAMHTLFHAIIDHLKITDIETKIGEDIQRERDAQSTMISTRGSGSDVKDGRDGALSRSASSPTEGEYAQRLRQLEDKISSQEIQLNKLNDLPSNTDLLERTRSEGTKPVGEMWQLMQLQRKVEANEAGLTKAMSLIEDLMREVNMLNDNKAKVAKEMKDIKDRLDKMDLTSLSDRISELESYQDKMKKIDELEKQLAELAEQLKKLPTAEEFDAFVTWPVLDEALREERQKYMELLEQLKSKDPSRPPSAPRPPSSRLSSAKEKYPEALQALKEMATLSFEHEKLSEQVEKLEVTMPTKADKSELEKLLEAALANQKVDVPEDLLEQLAALRDALDMMKNSRDKDGDMLANLQQKVLQLLADVEQLNGTSSDLVRKSGDLQKSTEALYKVCDKLNDTKADKDYVTMEVDVKADKRALESKVSRQQFDSSFNELNNLIQELLAKLDGQDGQWQDALKNLSDDLDGKLDRLELDPFKEYIQGQLNKLNRKMAKVTEIEQQKELDEAAGFRKQMFRCISCDRPVTMTAGGPVPALPSTNSLPVTATLRPYTTYELEKIRQEQKTLAQPAPQDYDLYFSQPRPCGGSHTMTYPNKRFTKLTAGGQYVVEEQPQVQVFHVKEELDIIGADGHIYKGRVEIDDGRLPTLTQRPHTAGSRSVSRTSQTHVIDESTGEQQHSPPPTRQATPGEGGAGQTEVSATA
ncbi:Glutamine-rich protein 2 [Branchiostoma belcheri]|nr:Glutamine-rich protein 2 [Branchiostoma belcheri]